MNDFENTDLFPPKGAETNSDQVPRPDSVGRYQIESILGEGGFGRVYLAYDEELQRFVAVKVPHRHRVRRPEDIEAFLAEARNLARLDHPNIVPVYDFGRTHDGLCYVVSKYIAGKDLRQIIHSGRPSFHDSAKLIATIADALHHSHDKGLVHRDVKPSNILIDIASNSYLADFGLALREEEFALGSVYPGSPAYMSPEQVHGEGHRIDGRCDIFSLGVTFYELLTGRRPFPFDSPNSPTVVHRHQEPPPPRQWNERIPKELERICLKAVAVRASNRYLTAFDMASDLETFLGEKPRLAPFPPHGFSRLRPFQVAPKGLNSFDAHDANFFLDLLPGPRDREGLPESIRFWKARMEADESPKTFAVGIIYGPSGCGKSSLVKAGLLPRLDKRRVQSLYLEASADDTETRLLNDLRKMRHDVPTDLGLTQTLATLRKAPADSQRPKVMIVIDQFEQWLHAHKEEETAELIQALRQCDGRRVMCLLLVRDDFWLAVSQFMQALEVRLVEGENLQLVNLFDRHHARKVLTLFGTALGALPETTWSREQEGFLDQAVAGLAEDGKVIPVRLALFAEMFKNKPWSTSTLKEVGGTKGVGVAFLDDSFLSSTAPWQHRLHRNAAQVLLKALLPEAGATIKGSMRSYQELRECSGYADRPRLFADLMQILIEDVRLIAPTTAEDPLRANPSENPEKSRFYQLTHDYMVPSLWEWLNRNQMQTWRGRAQRRLTDRTSLWRARPEARQLPSLWEWLQIQSLTAARTWSPPERKMMRLAAKKHLATLAWVCAGIGLLVGLGLILRKLDNEKRESDRAHALVLRLLDANIAEAPAIVQEIEEHRRHVDPELEQVADDPATRRDRRLRAQLGLLRAKPKLADELGKELLDCDILELPILRDALSVHAPELTGVFWSQLENDSAGARARLRAAAALAAYDTDNARWNAVSPWVAKQLIAQPSLVLSRWVDALHPCRAHLTPALVDRFLKEPTTIVADILTNYAAGRFDIQAKLLARAQPDSFAVLFGAMANQPARAKEALIEALDHPPEKNQNPNEWAAGQANLVLALLRLGVEDRLWPMLKMSPDPRCRSYLIDRLGPLGCPADLLLTKLATAEEDLRAPLLLALGNFDEQGLSPTRRAKLTPKILEIYRNDKNASVHAAARWLLGHWGQPLEEVPFRSMVPNRGWYTNSHGITMVKVKGPVTFLMGTPFGQHGWEKGENQRRAEIDHSFEIGMTEVTVTQFRRFLVDLLPKESVAPLPEDSPAPIVGITWYEAAAYCNWLSEKEGLPREEWCFEPNAQGEYAEGMKVCAGYQRRKGYRLPTEAEWEFACRGGAATSRSYGDAEELLPKYAWYEANAAEQRRPVAMLLPNALGIFDMLGNGAEWCLENRDALNRPPEELSLAEFILNKDHRAVRGAHSLSYARTVHSAKRFSDRPSATDGPGLRLARSSP